MTDPATEIAERLRRTLPPTPEERRQTLEETRAVIARLAALNPDIRRPTGPIHTPSAAELRAMATGFVRQAFGDDPIMRTLATTAMERIESAVPGVYRVIEISLHRNPEVVRSMLWIAAQRSYATRVEWAMVRAFIERLPIEARERSDRLRRTLGDGWVSAHLAVAAGTPVALPTQVMFAAGTAYKILADLAGLIAELLRYHARPEELTLEVLSALASLLELAFAEESDGIARGRELGGALAAALGQGVEGALFPDPLGTDGYFFYGPVVHGLLRDLGSDMVLRPASLLMVPFSLGAFIGPVLLDVGLAILGLLFPQLEAVLLARLGASFRRVMRVVDGVVDAALLRRRIDRLLPDAPGARAVGGRATGAHPDARGLPEGPVRAPDRATGPESRGTHPPAEPEPPHASPSPEERIAEARARRERRRADADEPRTRARAALDRVMARMRDEYGIDVDDPDTLDGLEWIFTRGRGRTTSGTVTLETHLRADAGELRQVIRYSRRGPRGDSSVRIRFIGEHPSRRSPDFVQDWLAPDGSVLRRHYVEVRTRTQGTHRRRVGLEEGSRSRRPVRVSRSDVERKLLRRQIPAGSEGTVVFHAPFQDVAGELDDWRRVFAELVERGIPAEVRRVEFTGHTDAVLVFEPPGWTGALVREARGR